MKYITAILTILFICGYINAQSLPARLIGKWKVEDKDQYEVWEKTTDNELKGIGYKLNGDVKMTLEYLTLKIRGSKVFYTAVVQGQNNEDGIDFMLVRHDNEEKWIFENLTHDFPNRIIYNFLGEHELLVEVTDKKSVGYSFSMFREKKKITTVPQWFLDDISRMAGTWVTSNAAYQSEDEPFEYYGSEWELGVGETSLLGKLYGVDTGGVETTFWRFHQYWDNLEQKAVVFQVGNANIIGKGYLESSSEVSTEAIQEFSMVDGRTWTVKHISAFDNDTLTSTSFDLLEAGEWKQDRSYKWTRKEE